MTVLSLALERLLSASGWMMWHAVGQSHGLSTVAITVLEMKAVITVKMLELFVTKVSWDGSHSMTMRVRSEMMHPIHFCTLVRECMHVIVRVSSWVEHHSCGDSFSTKFSIVTGQPLILRLSYGFILWLYIFIRILTFTLVLACNAIYRPGSQYR